MSASRSDQPPRRRLWQRAVRLIRGERFIDPPVRALALVLGLVGFLPSALETEAPFYVLLHAAANLLIIAAAFCPGAAAGAAAALYLTFLWTYPGLLNPYFQTGLVAAGVAFSQARWRTFALITLCFFGAQRVSAWRGAVDGEHFMLETQIFAWTVAIILGLSAALVEHRISQEIARREEAARAHEQELQRSRLDFALDTHDTVSHALATEAAIIKALGRSRTGADTDRTIGELAIVNAQAQRQLRRLLGRLNPEVRMSGSVSLARELDASLAAVRASAAVGGLTLTAHKEAIGASTAPDFCEAVALIVQELATNIIKHAVRTGVCSITVHTEEQQSARHLVLASRNQADSTLPFSPYSLQKRAEKLRGLCSADTDPDGIVTVRVTIPLPDPDHDLIRTDEVSTGASVVCLTNAHDSYSDDHGDPPRIGLRARGKRSHHERWSPGPRRRP
ncbi:hypothetical protein [Sediminivirga luteola]|uniref:hypothetical protein n=1 Tax=Sediminivirga luteola TaxID=1774748 RepID=UPI001F57E867|nr:hypothetical protein [Sediminivirga luteola]MCI2266675.1 hypothetical protein [Sediminivirga luteola]